MQHELPHRPVERSRRARRPVVRDDPARREPRARPSSRTRRACPSATVTNLAIWGNHSATQFPDFAHAKIKGKAVPDVIGDDAWLQGPFIETVQKRGAAVIEKRGSSSAASAAHAALDSVNSVWRHDPEGRLARRSPLSAAASTAIPEGLQFGFPVRSDGSSWDGRRGARARRLGQGKIKRDDRRARRRARRGQGARPV